MSFWQKMSSKKMSSISSIRKRISSNTISLWLVGVCIGVLFLGIGIGREQLTDMYRKAVMICLECIGIG